MTVRPSFRAARPRAALALEEEYSFASDIKYLLDNGWSVDGKPTENLVRSSAIEEDASSRDVLDRLKAAFARERSSNELQAARTALLCEHLSVGPMTLPLERGSGSRFSGRVGPVNLYADAPLGKRTAAAEEGDPVAGLSRFVDALLKGEADTAADPELPDAADEWAVLFDTRIKPRATDEFRFDDKRLGNLNQAAGENAPDWEAGMQQLGACLSSH
jgi:hypothetical protein